MTSAVSHEAFMQHALYDPQDGYYARRAAVGKTGDFSTSATLSPAFAEAVAHWIRETITRLKILAPCPVIELGPGNGSLAAALLSHFSEAEVRLHLVETSDPLRDIQLGKLGSFPVSHHRTLGEALKATNGIGLIIANEFADAFPAVQLCFKESAWWEVFVDFDKSGKPIEVLKPYERVIDAEAPSNPKENQRIFVHPLYHSWLKENLSLLKHGAMLTIDYGAEYPSGECRAYAGQQRYEKLDVYREAGRRDITCDVNFSDIRRWGEQLGFKSYPSLTQTEFLQRYLGDIEARSSKDSALAFLCNPMGAGGAFRVLKLER
ncbi:SAM-dependent methyltransferase [Rubellicoccus peritrichatus]|uniref:SAM-dependent methyltransferase n=1 Tax=Rubellicoccus peritrichatus TaxID=3080537 RepID=A0AAQ3QTF6_9BACT|nr:SAM-dependent methyltransferase [Puniceicoccus sp. CR14]WOO39318.1 SAM-dependent methyltransferase [Puniceicoccus sp. CR14]